MRLIFESVAMSSQGAVPVEAQCVYPMSGLATEWPAAVADHNLRDREPFRQQEHSFHPTDQNRPENFWGIPAADPSASCPEASALRLDLVEPLEAASRRRSSERPALLKSHSAALHKMCEDHCRLHQIQKNSSRVFRPNTRKARTLLPDKTNRSPNSALRSRSPKDPDQLSHNTRHPSMSRQETSNRSWQHTHRNRTFVADARLAERTHLDPTSLAGKASIPPSTSRCHTIRIHIRLNTNLNSNVVTNVGMQSPSAALFCEGCVYGNCDSNSDRLHKAVPYMNKPRFHRSRR